MIFVYLPTRKSSSHIFPQFGHSVLNSNYLTLFTFFGARYFRQEQVKFFKFIMILKVALKDGQDRHRSVSALTWKF
jgi:hypothetical protein